ncbi:hypothetical protein LJE86_09250 [bacterium BMS3Abin03]|nr:hypothetical protein [bacterium BMS3Abin03]
MNFKVSGEERIVRVDNGSETSHESFKSNFRKAFNGICLAVIQSEEKAGKLLLKRVRMN